jgi:membrane protein DedA with SNARE-associated domain/rhodanese-related sulfurtransferase
MSFRSLLLRHGYAFLFCYVFSVQAGVPIPADPLLLIMGALAGDGHYSLWISLLFSTCAAMAGDHLWYELGRRKGSTVLGLLCKLSLEPDTCVRKTEAGFAQRGAWTVVFCKFIPGMSLVSMPVAGAIRMSRGFFLMADAAGCLMWCAAYLTLGRLFHKQVDALVGWLGLFGQRAGIIALTLIAGYVGFRYWQRWRFVHQLRVNRISPEEAFALLNSGHPATIVDLRHPAEIQRNGLKIAGALVMRPDELRERSAEIPDDRDVILYCSCPNEVTSASVAMQLKQIGISRVRPLAGGFEAWVAAELPVEPILKATA